MSSPGQKNEYTGYRVIGSVKSCWKQEAGKYLKKPFKSVSVKKSNLEFCTALLPKTHSKYQKIRYMLLQLTNLS